jgi:hypothetical protein
VTKEDLSSKDNVSIPMTTPESVPVPVQVFEIDVSASEQIPTLAPRFEIARTPERISGATSVGVQGLPKGEVTREDLSSKDNAHFLNQNENENQIPNNEVQEVELELEPTQIVFEDFAKQAKDVVENVVEEPDTHQNDTNLEPEPLPQVHPMEQLRKMNINQLKTIAIQLGITTDISKLKKPELISLIREKENANE